MWKLSSVDRNLDNDIHKIMGLNLRGRPNKKRHQGILNKLLLNSDQSLKIESDVKLQAFEHGNQYEDPLADRLMDHSVKHMKKACLALIILLAVPLLVDVASAAKYKDRAPRYSFALSATNLSDERGNTLDIQGHGKFSLMGGTGWGPSSWWWNIWIDGHGTITFITGGNEESIKWKLGPTALYDQLSGTLTFTVEICGKPPNWVAEPIKVTLIIGSESTGSVTVDIGETSTYSGTGRIVIHQKT